MTKLETYIDSILKLYEDAIKDKTSTEAILIRQFIDVLKGIEEEMEK